MKKIITILLVAIMLCGQISVPTYAKTKWVTIKVEKRTYLGRFYCTHYCPCVRCCGYGGGKVTASGTKPTAGRTVGVNPRLIRYGTRLKIGNRSGYVAEDTGGGIGWYHIDVFCNSHTEALQRGVQTKKVWKIERVKIKKYKMFKLKMKTFKNKNYL